MGVAPLLGLVNRVRGMRKGREEIAPLSPWHALVVLGKPCLCCADLFEV